MKIDTFERWIEERPRWIQTAAARLIASQRIPTDAEISDLTDLCTAEASKNPKAAFEKVPAGSMAVSAAATHVRISKIDKVVGVNAIRENACLDLENKDLVVIFGPNGAGKSGFARLVKNVCGARTMADLLPNVFSDAPSSPSAQIVIAQNGTSETLDWAAKTGPIAKLRHVHVFDAVTAASYVTAKNVASYEPRRMRFISRLVEISERVAAELTRRKAALPSKLPAMPIDFNGTKATAFFGSLKHSTSQATLDAACIWTEVDTGERQRIETSLKQQDITGRLKDLELQKKVLLMLKAEVSALQEGLSAAKMSLIVAARHDAAEKRKTATEDAEKVFANAPLDGVGKPSWRLMWDQARIYSEQLAYPDRAFPAIDADDNKCVLCHQPLDAAAKVRLSDFEAFVRGGLESAAKTAEKILDGAIVALPVLPSHDKWRLDLGLVKVDTNTADAVFDSIQARRKAAEGHEPGADTPSVDWHAVDTSIAALAESLAKEEAELLELQKDGKKAEQEKALKELRAREWLSQQKLAVADEIIRRGAIRYIDEGMRIAGTNALTRKKNDLADEELAKGYRDRFVAELTALGGKRLLVSPVSLQEGKGKISFKLAMKGANTDAAAHTVLSDGESRVVALAAFLADITGSGQPTPFVFDDPISSLDQEFEERVANRLVALARSRQVIVFTHRLSLMALLDDALDSAKRNAAATGGTIPSRAFVSLRRIGSAVGFVDSLDVRRAKPDKGFVTIRDHRLPRLRKLLDAQDVGYDSELKAVCSDFRIIVERAVEKVMLNGLIERFRRSVQTQHIQALAKITPHDCALVDRMMTKYSSFEHSQSDELDGALPTLDEVSDDLDAMLAWISEFEKRAPA